MESKLDKKKIEAKLKKYSSDINFKTIEHHTLNKSPSKNVPSFQTGSLRFHKYLSYSYLIILDSHPTSSTTSHKPKPRKPSPSAMAVKLTSRENNLFNQPDIRCYHLLISKNYKENQGLPLASVD